MCLLEGYKGAPVSVLGAAPLNSGTTITTVQELSAHFCRHLDQGNRTCFVARGSWACRENECPEYGKREHSSHTCLAAQDQVVQNAPLNDQGTGPAPVGGSHFQPLGTNVGGISTPSQKTDSLLASMGQPKPQSSQQSGQQSGNRFENNPFFRYSPLPLPLH